MKHIDNKVAVHTAGSIVWWNLASGLKVEALTAAMEGVGIDWVKPPGAPTPEVALKRALDYLVEKRRFLRPLEKRGSWSLVAEKAEGEKLAHEQELTAKFVGGRLVIEPAQHPLVKDVFARFEFEQEVYDASDLGMWLANQVMFCTDGVPLRARGGVYFVPTIQEPNWLAVVAAIEEAARKSQVALTFYDLQPIMDPDKIDQILDCVGREAQQVMDDVDKELEAGKLGKRGLEHRLDIIDDARLKVRRYEESMSKNLPDFQDKIQALSARISLAILAAAGETTK